MTVNEKFMKWFKIMGYDDTHYNACWEAFRVGQGKGQEEGYAEGYDNGFTAAKNLSVKGKREN